MRRNFFNDNMSIHVPITRTSCAWKAPQKLHTKYALERLYKEDETFINFKHLSSFFTDVLGIKNCDPEINELEALKEQNHHDVDTISDIYAGLQSMKSRIIGLTRDEIR